MTALRTPVEVTGASAGDASVAVSVSGEPLRKIHFNATNFYVTKDTTSIPPRTIVSARVDAESAGLPSRMTTAEADIDALEDDVGTLQESVDGVVDLTWAATITPDFSTISGRTIRITAQAGTFTLANPTGATEGIGYRVIILSGGGGDNAWGSDWSVGGTLTTLGITNLPLLSTDPDEIIIADFVYVSGKMRCMMVHMGAV